MKRITLYAAFHGDGVPCINVWDFDRKRAETLLNDRRANGEAFPDERIVRITTEFYNRVLRRNGLPELRNLQRPA